MRVHALSLLLAAVASAGATAADDIADCRQSRSSELRIRGCTAIVADHGASIDEKAMAFRNRAAARADAGALPAAIADYSEALKLQPGQVQALAGRGLVRFTAGDAAGALADYDAAIRQAPASAQLLLERGHIRLTGGDADGAIADIGEAIRLAPRNALAYNNRGLAWRKKGNLDRAIADYTEAIAVNPIYANAYANRGYAYESLGRKADATADFSNALQLDPSMTEARRALQRLGATEPMIAETQQRVASGKALVEAKCSRCHGTAAEGASPNAKAPEFRNLRRRHPMLALREPLSRGIAATHEEMPKFGLTDSEIDAIVAYINSLSGGT